MSADGSTRGPFLLLKDAWRKARNRTKSGVLAGTEPSAIQCGGKEVVLPVDILERVFGELRPCMGEVEGFYGQPVKDEYVSFQLTLHTATLVCRTWCAIATKYLYKEPCIRTLRAADRFYTTLCANNELPPLVEQLLIFRCVVSAANVPHRDDIIMEYREERYVSKALRKMLRYNHDKPELPLPQSRKASHDAPMADRVVKIAEKCFGIRKENPTRGPSLYKEVRIGTRSYLIVTGSNP